MASQRGLFDESIGGPGLDVVLVRGALDEPAADAAFAALRVEIPWRQEHLRMFGSVVPVPRLEAWIADEGLEYTYSGIAHTPQPWTPAVVAMRALCADLAGASFNSVLCNLYRDGNDGVDWHADDEREFGRHPVIASVSLGATRRFDFRRVDDHSVRTGVDLHHGDVVIMRGTTQELWRHRIPKTRRSVGERINLTFREVLRR
ncbi:MAG: alpha-ketoglutarate-dependent dioxygenase AlkB [Acidimicrobiia bacterium]|nr:alpha-ketoglutarate-dependent dioxygenase AlkB [Acidimicrobiia bacterium]